MTQDSFKNILLDESQFVNLQANNLERGFNEILFFLIKAFKKNHM